MKECCKEFKRRVEEKFIIYRGSFYVDAKEWSNPTRVEVRTKACILKKDWENQMDYRIEDVYLDYCPFCGKELECK